MKKAGEGKDITFRFSLKDVPFCEVLGAALTPKKITKQNHIRSHWEAYKDGQVIEFNWSGRQGVDPELVYKTRFGAMTKEAQEKEIARLKELMKK
jgi:hypothetical protein